MEDSVEAAFLHENHGVKLISLDILLSIRYCFPYCYPLIGHAYGFLWNIQNQSNFYKRHCIVVI